ncbi:MAG TPA: GNAT family N-acetyltransferase [Clostridia bacterium]|nr:GNAT family N-acetyltransferase [Clostridia bacterium]
MIRQAKADESAVLTDIAIRSEAYWGYDPDFMNSFKTTYKVTDGFINKNPTYILEEQEKILGFYGLSLDKEETELEYLYIDPLYIGKGYGKRLWNHMVGYCKENGIDKIVLVTSPQAVGFYTKLGAWQIGEVESLVRKGRMVPKLIYYT